VTSDPVTERLLMGPGPSLVHPRVLAAMSRPLVGHLDPQFLRLLDKVQAMLRQVFRTNNALTLPISGTGSAGMETCLGNLIEEGDEVVVGVCGVFGARMAEVAGRLGARVTRVEAAWGETIRAEQIEEALRGLTRPRLVALVHAETSTGAWQAIDEIASVVRRHDALFVLDAVTSLAGCAVEVDGWRVDACYSGTQKCLSCPPGLAPVTLGPRAIERLRTRTSKPRSWYLDLRLIGSYFDDTERVYHHTAPISMVYALAEALEIVLEEGLDQRFARHELNHRALLAGLRALGIEPAVNESRLWMLNSVRVPHGVGEIAVRRGLLVRHCIEIGAGLGKLAGVVWRIGLMGESCRPQHVRRLLLALAAELPGTVAPSGAGREAVDAANAVYARATESGNA